VNAVNNGTVINEENAMNDNRNRGISTGELATILGGAFLFNYGIVLIWFLIFKAVPDWLFGMNARWFAISRHEFDLINYGGIAFFKVINIAFFLSPYLAIKVWLRRKHSS
jgi:hypothetical protein